MGNRRWSCCAYSVLFVGAMLRLEGKMWRMQPGERCERMASMSMALKAAIRASEVRFWGDVIFYLVAVLVVAIR